MDTCPSLNLGDQATVGREKMVYKTAAVNSLCWRIPANDGVPSICREEHEAETISVYKIITIPKNSMCSSQ